MIGVIFGQRFILEMRKYITLINAFLYISQKYHQKLNNQFSNNHFMTHTLTEFASFAKKKGFFYPSSEIYGGVAGLYDYGHLGTLLKKNFENLWRKYFLGLDSNFFEIETAHIMPEHVFKASGHLENFIDPLVHCSKCPFSDRADHFIEKSLKKRVEGQTTEQLTALIQK